MTELTAFAATARRARIALMAAIAFFFSLVVFNNLTDFNSNYEFVRHVLLMDSTFPGNHGLWRALHPASLHLAFYAGIIAYETLNAILCWAAAIAMFRARSLSPAAFTHAKRLAVNALTAGILLWLVAFLEIGAEWFLMWQSKTWNGQEAAFRMLTIEAIFLVVMLLPEPIE
jgi:predicted small integral membrane protein